jgi:ABC-type uncharacterized transport system auxiliary subunit
MKKSTAYALLFIATLFVVAMLSSCATTHSCHDTFQPKHNGNYNSRGTNWW